MTCESIAKEHCADYMHDGPLDTKHFCVNGDKVCVFYAPDFIRCNYFEGAVLPAWPDVAAEYAVLCGQRIGEEIEAARMRGCGVCGRAFTPKSNRQQYCSPACQMKGNRAVTKHRMRRSRQSVLEMS